MLSSIGGDALAAHRVYLGLPATSLGLGVLLSVGYVAENLQQLHSVNPVASLMDAIREEDIHRMVEYHSNPKNFATRPFQIASGLTPAAQYASSGILIPSWMHSPLFLQLASTSSTATATLRSDDADSS
ncbi:hypothetical protein CIHG_01628 [Coccidioides immitis H538.4]|uniref:Uncharacterized protein n=3 Tax=Coccidioides immitis TaxID=5501 RepID=A0A0J8R8Y8_COCIT|nr:hypothetical protein CIRG_01479 [Coccidioides immitis RMSCC 2394]KMU81504.1 hypothetical protein CISG_09174 [Coccidioides immitis RMSCC 3703]KMU83844.1 hypothetical protein CIHG_01628 [Coccidioides immitis H538.4]